MASTTRLARVVLLAGALLPGCHSSLRLAAHDGAAESATAQGEAASLPVEDARAMDVASPDETGPIDAGLWMPDGLPPICGYVTASTTRTWFDVLLVVDRSSSMGLSMTADVPCAPDAGDCTSRWDAVESSLLEQVAYYPRVRWGLIEFPSPGGDACEIAAAPQVPLDSNTGAAIGRALGATTPDGDAPTGPAIRAATSYLASVSDTYGKAILLLTAGGPSCGGLDGGDLDGGDPQPSNAVAAADTARAAGYPLYVIALGPGSAVADQLAAAGGTTRAYVAASKRELDEVLGQMFYPSGCFVASCTFSLVEAPPDPARIYVYLDGEPVPRNEADGWSFGATSSIIVLNGTYCEHTIDPARDSVEVLILLGCAGP